MGEAGFLAPRQGRGTLRRWWLIVQCAHRAAAVDHRERAPGDERPQGALEGGAEVVVDRVELQRGDAALEENPVRAGVWVRG